MTTPDEEITGYGGLPKTGPGNSMSSSSSTSSSGSASGSSSASHSSPAEDAKAKARQVAEEAKTQGKSQLEGYRETAADEIERVAQGAKAAAEELKGDDRLGLSGYVSDVAEVGRLVGGDRKAAIVLYCNGPFCGKSKRLAEELLAAGYSNVRRYQLGIPVWRALGGVTEIEPEGLAYVLGGDSTAVVIDAREPDAYKAGTITGARSIPRSGVLDGKDVGEVKRAKDDGRLPMEDHNTRLIVVGSSVEEARHVARALAREAFHNVSYFPGPFEQARAAVKGVHARVRQP